MPADVLNFPKRPLGITGPTLALGSKGRAVTDVQGLLQGLGFDVNADGVFGPETQAAVKKFQSDNGLTADGVVGVETYKALTSKLPANASFAPGSTFANQTSAPDQTYQPVSRPGVQQGGSAASFYAPFTKVYGGRPLWQWGLVAAGIVGALYWLHTQTDGPVGGYKRLIKDVTPKSRAKHPGTEVIDGKCRRVPNSGKLDTAEPLEAVA